MLWYIVSTLCKGSIWRAISTQGKLIPNLRRIPVKIIILLPWDLAQASCCSIHFDTPKLSGSFIHLVDIQPLVLSEYVSTVNSLYPCKCPLCSFCKVSWIDKGVSGIFWEFITRTQNRFLISGIVINNSANNLDIGSILFPSCNVSNVSCSLVVSSPLNFLSSIIFSKVVTFFNFCVDWQLVGKNHNWLCVLPNTLNPNLFKSVSYTFFIIYPINSSVASWFLNSSLNFVPLILNTELQIISLSIIVFSWVNKFLNCLVSSFSNPGHITTNSGYL